MSSTAARHSPASPPAQPVREFLSSLEALTRHADRVEKLPRKHLLEQLSASDNPWAEANSLLRHISVLTRRFEQIRQTLQDEQVGRIAEAARHRGDARLERLVGEQALLEPAEFAHRLGWTRQALSKALAARRVFFVEVQGARYYPAFFADAGCERRQVEAVSKALGDLPGAAKLRFMTTPKGSLAGLTPLQALARGQVAAAKAAAEAFAQM